MTTHRLPGRIAAVMVGAIVVLVLTTCVSIMWVTRELDEQSRDHSSAVMRTAFANVLAGVKDTTLDYSRLTDATRAVETQDLAWLYNNVGVSATVGKAFHVVIFWGGPLEQEVGWINDRVQQGVSGLLGTRTLRLADTRLREVPVGVYEGVSFFAWRGGELFAVAASRVEEAEPRAGAGLRDADYAHLLMGQRVGDEMIRQIEASTLLQDVVIGQRQAPGRLSLPLWGGDLKPVAYVSWRTPQPGTHLLREMLPLLVAVTALTTGLVLFAMMLTRRSAHQLIEAGHQASVAARTDALTGLPNREAFNAALALSAETNGRAVLFLDLNGFKRINDSIGHAAGDLVIIAMARRLADLCGPRCLLARIGGDEFVFVLTVDDARFHVARLARAVERAMAAPFDVLGHQLSLGAAMGYAVQPSAATDGADLVRQADLAMYEAKRHPGGGAVAFSEMIDRADRDASAIEVALKAALAAPGELWIAYQPIVDMATGRLVRAEALARWTSPALGPVGPDRFIAVAEQSGLIVELGRQLMGLICDDLAAHPALMVSVNVSPLQLMAPGFVPDLVAELSRRAIPTSRIEIELTESVVVDDPGLAAARLAELHAAGFSTALDDFGTGYSSIGYLKQMGFDVVKIDRSFVSGLCETGERMTLVNAMILLCHAMRLRVVCEGIETGEELAMLRELGCNLAQGYHLDRPLPIGRLIERWVAPKAQAAVA